MNTSFTQLFPHGGDDGEDDGDEAHFRAPPWFGPPGDELGAVVPLGLVVGRSESGVVALPHATVYSTGLAFDVLAAARGLSNAQSNRLFHEQHLFEEDEEPPSGFLRIGLELPGGARVSNLGGRMHRRQFMKPDEEPDFPVFLEHGCGGGSSGRGRVSLHPAFWLWPIPGPGTLRVFCEWPVVEIPLSTVKVEGAVLAEAATQVAPLWPAPSA